MRIFWSFAVVPEMVTLKPLAGPAYAFFVELTPLLTSRSTPKPHPHFITFGSTTVAPEMQQPAAPDAQAVAVIGEGDVQVEPSP